MVSPRHARRAQRGISMIEVLITIVILATGLMGLAGLQGRLQMSEMEGYQRAQAMILLEDMGHRLAGNRNAAASYAIAPASPVGAGTVCPQAAVSTKDRDLRDWCLALQGAGEREGATNLGAMIGGRGCIEALGNSEYMITVAWQGLAPVAPPPASVACGRGLYNGTAASGCVEDRCRRAITTIVKIAPLI